MRYPRSLRRWNNSNHALICSAVSKLVVCPDSWRRVVYGVGDITVYGVPFSLLTVEGSGLCHLLVRSILLNYEYIIDSRPDLHPSKAQNLFRPSLCAWVTARNGKLVLFAGKLLDNDEVPWRKRSVHCHSPGS